MTTVHIATVSTTSPTTTTSTKAEKSKAKSRAYALVKTQLMPGAPTRGRSASPDKAIETLRTGKIVRNGKEITIGLGHTLDLILSVIKKGGQLPTEVLTRFPWGAVSREALAELASVAGVDIEKLQAALQIGAPPAPEAPTPEAPPEAPAPEAPAPVAPTGRRRR